MGRELYIEAVETRTKHDDYGYLKELSAYNLVVDLGDLRKTKATHAKAFELLSFLKKK